MNEQINAFVWSVYEMDDDEHCLSARPLSFTQSNMVNGQRSGGGLKAFVRTAYCAH